MTEHTPTPWNLCGEGKCSCLTISCADYPIAKIQAGKWGDDYPAMRQVGASLENKYEAYMEQITYGEINPDLARENARFIVKAVNNHDALVHRLNQVRGDLHLCAAALPHGDDLRVILEMYVEEVTATLGALVESETERGK